ncbi:MAG: hypothetical protein ACFHX7_16005 [Pseudomonadota bacterium]
MGAQDGVQERVQERVQSSALLAVMADGIGEFAFGAADWVASARDILEDLVAQRREQLAGLSFTLCEVGHNAPAWLHAGPTLAWHATFRDGQVEVVSGELPDSQCDFKVQGDHSILSNLARIQYHGKDPGLVAAAQARLQRLSRWQVHGKLPEHPALASVLRRLHDRMAAKTLPRFVFMTPEWVSCARHLLSARAASEKYAADLQQVNYVFSEEFFNTPGYAFPDGSHGGFWVHCALGDITVGAGPLPAALGPADALTLGDYTPVVPVGRTVNAAMSDADKAEQTRYSAAAFRFDKAAGRRAVEQTSPSGRGAMPPALGRVFLPLHDELSKRTSGELPADYEPVANPAWQSPQGFDRPAGYDVSWLRYDKVDIYGNPR